MNTDLMNIARRFSQSLIEREEEIVGILLRGSSAIGIRDEYTDLDFDLIVPDEALNRTRLTADEALTEGVEVCWGYKSLESVEAELHEWLRDTDLWAYSTAKIMYDPLDKLSTLLSQYRQYPEPVRLEKMFSYFYNATAASPYNSDKAIHRNDFSTAQLFLANAVELYTAVIYLINKSFIPYRKWRMHQLEKLPWKPHDFTERIANVLFSEASPRKENLHQRQKILVQIMNEIKPALIQEGVDPRKLGDDIWRYEPKYLPSI
jgi:hypothetical protein